mgnify:CR=1 FL=1|jgi:hypothetical protein
MIRKLECQTQFDIQRIEQEELSAEGLFGADQPFATMKDFILDHMEGCRKKQVLQIEKLEKDMER